MNNVTKERLRWTAVVCVGGYGSFQLLASLRFMLSRPEKDWVFLLVFGIPTVLLVYGPLVLAAYFCGRRRYRTVLLMLSGVLAVQVFLFLGGLPVRSGFDHWLFSPEIAIGHWWSPLLVIVAGLVSLIVPFYVARWVFRLGLRTADRHFPTSSTPPRPI